jgi:hypothetical protein
MPIYVRFVDGSDHMLEMQSSDEEAELANLLTATGWPYDQGWIQLAGSGPPRYAALRQVLSVEIREPSDASSGHPHIRRP